MGMILFTQSGTFKPSDHGLSVGDAIQVLAIGGGQLGTETLLVMPVALAHC